MAADFDTVMRSASWTCRQFMVHAYMATLPRDVTPDRPRVATLRVEAAIDQIMAGVRNEFAAEERDGTVDPFAYMRRMLLRTAEWCADQVR